MNIHGYVYRNEQTWLSLLPDDVGGAEATLLDTELFELLLTVGG